MDIQITAHPPRTQCYKCGSTHVEAVCHHCRRAMCEQHIRRPVDSNGRLLSIEFTELGLKETCGEIPVHCEFCHHLVHPSYPGLVVTGVVIFLLALILPLDISTKFFGGLFGGAMAILSYYINLTRTKKLIQSKPPLPLLPRYNTIQIHEIVRGKISLNANGDYGIIIPYAQGVLTLISNFGKTERDQLEQYERKYHLDANQDVQFNAGFVTLRTASGIDYFDSPSVDNNTVWALRGTQPFSTNVERHGSGEWRKSRRYDIPKNLATNSFPIRIVPSLMQQTGRRALDLEIQWTVQNTDKRHLRIHKIDLLELQVPVRWGQIQDAGRGVVGQYSNLDDIFYSITWRGLPITDNERKKHQRTFTISFEDTINVSDSICGTLVVTFKGTLSGIKGIDLFYPLGNHCEAESVDISTQLIIDFDLSLSGLRYQDIRVVPDRNLKEDKDKLDALIVKGITPDHNTVIMLTNAISEEFYIKRIIENPPSIGEQANLVNRYWDIAGRYYDGVYPIDYHLMLSGEVIKEDELSIHSGMTKARLTVQGTYANEEMEDIIVNFWERLRHLIRTNLEQMSKKGLSVHQDTTKLSPAIPSQNIGMTISADARSERIIMLRKRLDGLFEQFTKGRLSEENFVKLKLETEKELISIQSKPEFNSKSKE